MGETGTVCDFRVLSRVRLSVTVRAAWKERRRRVLCPVGLCKGSPGEFRCAQRLLLGALFDGRKRRCKGAQLLIQPSPAGVLLPGLLWENF